MRILSAFLLCAAAFLGSLGAADALPALRVQEELRAADQARSRAGSELQAWRLESERLAASTAGLQAEVTRAESALAASQQALAAARQEQQALAAGDTPVQRLQVAARETRAALIAQAAELPPGALVVPGDDAPGAVLAALEASQRASTTVVVELAAGHTRGAPAEARTAVRLLRVASLAWWMALDGPEAGTAVTHAGQLELIPAEGRSAECIRRAFAIADGRAPAEPVDLLRPGAAP
jgi:hypothetical protein